MFERELARATHALGVETRSVTLDTGRGLIPSLWSALGGARALVVSLPVVAWKRVLVAPLLALALARLRGVKTIVVAHEWADLNPMRRAAMTVYLLWAQTVFLSAPGVRRDFENSLVGRLRVPKPLIPIPSNIAPRNGRLRTDAVERLAQERSKGRLVIGHFGSIYPKKQSELVLDIAAALRRSGRDVFVAFIGGFVRGHAEMEAQFRARVQALGLDDRVLVTGYVANGPELSSLFDEVDAFVYAFSEGLTSRRGSVLACLQAGRLVVVNAPGRADEFDHHPTFRRLIAANAVHFVPIDAEPEDYARALARIDTHRLAPALSIFRQAWRDAALALCEALR